MLAASTSSALAASDLPSRPHILFQRWQEDWSVLANPAIPREPLDDLKYMPLAPNAYLSLGANLRELFEANDAVNFGINGAKPREYVISRLEAHADLHWDGFQAFVQFQSDFAPGKQKLTPVDQDRLDLEQAFVDYKLRAGNGTLWLRAGRQQIAFDLQRFISVRDGPNVRQSYDALWVDYDYGDWRFLSFYSQPVQNRDLRTFDDYSSNHLTYGGLRTDYTISPQSNVTVILSQFKQDNAHFVSVSGTELRNILDLRYGGQAGELDWDLEWMGQAGHIRDQSIRSWGAGLRAGYTVSSISWTPRFGIQIDAASGDRNSRDKTLGTFNPLFPNGYYFTLSGYTGYTNLVHVKPSVTVKPLPDLTAMLAVAAQWRETTADAVYTFPELPMPGTAGHSGSYTGTYIHARLDWQVTSHLTAAVEAVRFQVAEPVLRAGGHDATYLGIESKVGW